MIACRHIRLHRQLHDLIRSEMASTAPDTLTLLRLKMRQAWDRLRIELAASPVAGRQVAVPDLLLLAFLGIVAALLILDLGVLAILRPSLGWSL